MKSLMLSASAGTAIVALALTISPAAAQDQTEATDVDTQASEITAAEETTSTDGRPEIVVEGETEAGPAEITDRSHPDYVRCRRERVMGSLAQRKRTCMTNREWRRIADEGNRRSNQLVDEMRATSLPNN